MIYRLRKVAAEAMREHVERSFPKECCGLLGGKGDLFADYCPLANSAEDPTTSFLADPKELATAMLRMRRSGRSLLGIHHSHPTSTAYPSAADVKAALYPEAINFISSFFPKRILRAFQIKGSIVNEVEFAVIE